MIASRVLKFAVFVVTAIALQACGGEGGGGSGSPNNSVPYMVVPRRASFSDVKFQRACSLTFGLFVQNFRPAGPDGYRERSLALPTPD